MGRYSRKEKLKLALFRYIEAELRDYPENRQRLKDMRSDMILKSPAPDEGSQISSRNSVSKPTESTALQLITNKRLAALARTVTAIEKTVDMLDGDRRRLVELRYFEKYLTPAGVAKELHISERTFYNWRDEVIKLIAVELGLANAADLA